MRRAKKKENGRGKRESWATPTAHLRCMVTTTTSPSECYALWQIHSTPTSRSDEMWCDVMWSNPDWTVWFEADEPRGTSWSRWIPAIGRHRAAVLLIGYTNLVRTASRRIHRAPGGKGGYGGNVGLASGVRRGSHGRTRAKGFGRHGAWKVRMILNKVRSTQPVPRMEMDESWSVRIYGVQAPTWGVRAWIISRSSISLEVQMIDASTSLWIHVTTYQHACTGTVSVGILHTYGVTSCTILYSATYHRCRPAEPLGLGWGKTCEMWRMAIFAPSTDLKGRLLHTSLQDQWPTHAPPFRSPHRSSLTEYSHDLSPPRDETWAVTRPLQNFHSSFW